MVTTLSPVYTVDLNAGKSQPPLPKHPSFLQNNPPSAPLPLPTSPTTTKPTHSMQTCSKTRHLKPCQTLNLTHQLHQTTTTYSAAIQQPNWHQAMLEEYQALKSQNTWVVIPPSTDQNLLGCCWTYKIKYNVDGYFARYKAHLVAQGFKQQKGLGYHETFSSVDPSLFSITNQHIQVYLLIYMDDILLTGNDLAIIDSPLSTASGIQNENFGQYQPFSQKFSKTPTTYKLHLNQTSYAKDILHKAGMTNCKHAVTPCFLKQQQTPHNDQDFEQASLYHHIISSL